MASAVRSSGSLKAKNMKHSVVLMDARHQTAFPTPDAELVFFNAPFNCDELARIHQAHLWSPPVTSLRRCQRYSGACEVSSRSA
jgi:hypothetical protein